MKYYLPFTVFLLLFLQGCNDDNSLKRLEFYWDQTGCSDPWNTSSNYPNEETQAAVENYLKSEGVKRAKVLSITNDGVLQGCFACFCTTGRRINVKVPANQKSKMLELGFQVSN